MKLSGKIALVTGGGLRLGKAISMALSKEGVGICIQYRSSKEEAEATAHAIVESGGKAWAVKSSLDSEDACRDLIDAAKSLAGGLDLLVNNAAAFGKATFETLSAARLDEELWPNLYAPMLLMKYFAADGAEGKVVNLLDRRISTGDPQRIPYVISKKSLQEATRMAALEFAPGVAVNAVAPGAVLPPPAEGEAYLKEHAGPVPLEKQITPDDIARATLFLVKEDCYTGQVLYVDGGQHLYGMSAWV